MSIDKKGFEDKRKTGERIKVAVLADSPTVVTGFGNVCREILTHLYNTGLYDFEIVGINYDGSPHDLPFKIHPAMNALVNDHAYREPYGRQKFLDVIGEGRFDLVWVLQDTFIVCEELAERIRETNEAMPEDAKFQFIFYYPIDATPKKRWMDAGVMQADIPVVYTQYGYEESIKVYMVGEDSKLKPEEQAENKAKYADLATKLQVIPHGVNTTDFYPLPQEKVDQSRQRLWGEKKDKFVFMNVNRNQPRKDLFRTMQAFKILLDRRRAMGLDDVYLYLHCNIFDNNINLIDAGKHLGLVEGDEFAFPDPKAFGPSSGFPIHVLNEIYNAADCVVTTTLGEGWGLSVTEAMAVKKPVIAPDHTSLSEMLGKTDAGTAERGFLVKTGTEFLQQNDNGRVRPTTDPVAMADIMEAVLENRERIQPIVDRAFEWVTSLAWAGERVGKRWEGVFEQAYENTLAYRHLSLDASIAAALKAQKLGRNDVCPVCNIKIKNCRHN